MVKEKPNSVRTYDAEGFRRRASCLCFRDKTEQEVFCLQINYETHMTMLELADKENCKKEAFI